jgi:hypothetical protein
MYRITLRKLKDKYNWGLACEVLGLNPYCFNEGRASDTDTVVLTEEQVNKIGIVIDL